MLQVIFNKYVCHAGYKTGTTTAEMSIYFQLFSNREATLCALPVVIG